MIADKRMYIRLITVFIISLLIICINCIHSNIYRSKAEDFSNLTFSLDESMTDNQGLEYTIYDIEQVGIRYAKVTGYNITYNFYDDIIGYIFVPANVIYEGKTYPVTKIDVSVFSGYDKLTHLNLSDNCETINNIDSSFH